MGKFSLEQTIVDESDKAKNLLHFMVKIGAGEAAIQEKMGTFPVSVQDAAIASLKSEGKIKDKV